jgi:hypothetical protein
MDDQSKAKFHIAYGVALVLAGFGVLYRIPQVAPNIARIEQFAAAMGFVYFCFYLLAVLLIAGGAKKIYTYYRMLKKSDAE